MNTMNTPQNHDLSATKSSVKAALTANRQLQTQIARELERVMHRKQQNRNAAAACLKHICTLEAQQPEEVPTLKSRAPSMAQVTALMPDQPPTTVKRRRSFRYDPDRKWQLEFWTDPTGSSPEENSDTKTRRKLEPLSTSSSRNSSSASGGQTRPFSSEESELILQQPAPQNADWHEIAAQLQDRTAFECLQHYHQKKKPEAPSVPSAQEELVDTTLLHYLALQGPQFVWDLPSSAHSSGLIGGGKFTHKQLRIKANTTQTVNPNYIVSSNSLKQFWKMDDQRKLVLAMKVYSNQTYPNPVQLASMHFPNRPTSYVTKKWERTLNPKKTKKKKQKLVEENSCSSSDEE
jgi:hypothetical protein